MSINEKTRILVELSHLIDEGVIPLERVETFLDQLENRILRLDLRSLKEVLSGPNRWIFDREDSSVIVENSVEWTGPVEVCFIPHGSLAEWARLTPALAAAGWRFADPALVLRCADHLGDRELRRKRLISATPCRLPGDPLDRFVAVSSVSEKAFSCNLEIQGFCASIFKNGCFLLVRSPVPPKASAVRLLPPVHAPAQKVRPSSERSRRGDTIRRRTALALCAALLLCVRPLWAAEHNPNPAPEEELQTAPKVSAGFSAGVAPAFSLPGGELFATFVFAGPSLTFSIHGPFSLIAGVSFEVAPDAGNWGFAGALTADFLVLPWLALDVGVQVLSDEDPALRAATGTGTTGAVGVSAGAGFILPNGVSIAPGVLFTLGFDGQSGGVAPSLAVSFPIEAPTGK